MKAYKTKEIVRFQAGNVLGLTDEQFKKRKHVLVDLGKSLYRNTAIVEFKQGEIIKLDKVPLFYVDLLELVKKEAE